jgi:hypothetical protein
MSAEDVSALQRVYADMGAGRFTRREIFDLSVEVVWSEQAIDTPARGRESGAQAERRYGHLWTMRNGKAVKLETADPDAAYDPSDDG